MNALEILHPVVLAVPPRAADLSPRSKVAYLSRHARKALAVSADQSRIALGRLQKGPNGRPLPFNGVHWSLTHKPLYVAAVVSRRQVGIDLEQIRPRRTRALFHKAGNADEWRLVGEPSWNGFYRFWTAKEAVLKAAGIGLSDLSDCRIVALSGGQALTVRYRERDWQVDHFYFDGHIASIVGTGQRIDWTLIGAGKT
jgi:4'-phosphopantetheinyl transferase